MWMILVWELLLKFKLLEIVDWNDAVDNDDGDDDDDNDDALDDDDGKNDDIDDQMILGWVLQCGWPGWAFIIVVLPLALMIMMKMMVMMMLMVRPIVVDEHDDDVHSADDQVEPS